MMKVALGVLSGLILSLPLLQAADDAGKENKSPKAKTVEIQATVHYVGNSYTRLPDGKIIGTLRFHPYEGCFIMVKDRKVNLEFLPAMELVDQQSLGGRNLILTGTWGKDVFVVTGYRAAPGSN